MAIMDVYRSSFEHTISKKVDQTPLTLADQRAHQIIMDGLSEIQEQIPVISEEGEIPSFEKRKDWERYWLVDPLDGTREFINRNGDFTVNIALIERNRPVMGVVLVPVTGELYWALKGQGAYLNMDTRDITISVQEFETAEKGLRIMASRSHMSQANWEYISKFREAVLIQRGSSLKIMAIAAGNADLYPRLGPTMEWDTAASQIILEEAGGKLLSLGDAKPLEYNKFSLKNPHFVAFGRLKTHMLFDLVPPL